MINWKVRMKNIRFWAALIPAVMLVIQSAAAMLGYSLALEELQGKLLDMVNAVFGLLAILGIVNDPTTQGYADSARAMTYDTPAQ